MRTVMFLAPMAILAAAPAMSQAVIELEGVGQRNGAKVLAVERLPGPNAQAAKRPAGPNGALARESRLLGRAEPYYPSCAAAGVDRAPPVRRGEPGYGRHLDPDGDGLACE